MSWDGKSHKVFVGNLFLKDYIGFEEIGNGIHTYNLYECIVGSINKKGMKKTHGDVTYATAMFSHTTRRDIKH